MIRSSHRNSNREEKSQFSIIFVLASQYRSHSVLLDNAVHCPRCKVDQPPRGAPWATSLTAKWSTTLA